MPNLSPQIRAAKSRIIREKQINFALPSLYRFFCTTFVIVCNMKNGCMTKIAFIHNTFPSGGAERVTIDIARHLSTLGGYEVFVYATRLADGLMPKDLSHVLTTHVIPSQAIQRKRSRYIEKRLVTDDIDILVMVGKSINDLDGIKRRTGVQTVIACHGEPFWQRYIITHRRQQGVFRRLMWLLYNKRRFADGTRAIQMAMQRTSRDYALCDAYTVLCDAYKTEMMEMLQLDPQEEHLYVIENSEYPVERVCYTKEKEILFCGRLEHWSKRVDRLLRAWGAIQHDLPEWRLTIVGDGPARRMLHEQADALRLERISFEGRQEEMSRYYQRASVVCLTSETEGWGLALTEAQAHGCIGVAFGCTAGIQEVLSPHGECGFIVPPFDEKAYAETLLHIARLSREEELGIRMSSVKKRLRYAPTIIVEKWRRLFDTLMDNKRQRESVLQPPAANKSNS